MSVKSPAGWMPVFGQPLAVPCAMLSEAQARLNHGQSLQELTDRGGVSLAEIAALAEGRAWKPMTSVEALDAIQAAWQRFERARGQDQPPGSDG